MGTAPDKIWLFRMLHWTNVEHVLRHGLCHREHEDADPGYVNIGHKKLIDDRHTHVVPMNDAGTLGEYVPFYFAGHTPMLLKIKTGNGRVVQRPQKDIVFVMCDLEEIKKRDLNFIFTDRNAKLDLANYYKDDADLNMLHWDIIKSKQWSNNIENLARQDFKQAEFLIRHHMPIDCIYALVVKTTERKVYFDEMMLNLGLEIDVIVDKSSKLYY